MNVSASSSATAALVDRCNQIDLRHIGGVQPHGALLVISEDERRIVQFSANIGEFIPEITSSPEEYSVSEVAAISEAFRALGSVTESPSKQVDTIFRGRQTALSFDRVRGVGGEQIQLLTCELAETPDSPPPPVSRLVAPLLECAEVASLWSETVRIFSELTQFDRVLLYRFLPDWSGEVVAEESTGFNERYLHLRFPSTDLPASARAMYRQCRVRIIADSFAEPIPIINAKGLTDSTVDISLSPVRSVAETHRVYLRNMGVRASVSFPIIKGEDLWGLVACHHRTPRFLPHSIRNVGCELASVISAQLFGFDAAARMEVIHNSRSFLEHILCAMEDFNRLQQDEKLSSENNRWFGAEGFAFFNGDKWRVLGRVPDEITLMAIRDVAYRSQTSDGVLMSDNLSALLGMTASAAGMVAVIGGGGICAWFRPEVTEQVTWAGKPDDWGELGREDGLLRPRSSFGKWVEEKKGHSAPWTHFDRHKAVVWRAAFVRKFPIAAPLW